jgi:hypothetical protein
MEPRFTILAVQNRNFRRMSDEFQAIKGGEGGSMGGTVGAKNRAKIN